MGNGEGSGQAVVLNDGAGAGLADGAQFGQSQRAATLIPFVATDLIPVEEKQTR